MKQQDPGLNRRMRCAGKAEFLDEIEGVAPFRELVALVSAVALPKQTGYPLFSPEDMLFLHSMQQLFNLSDQTMEEALFETPLYREFAGLADHYRQPDCVTISCCRHLCGARQLGEQLLAAVLATLKAKGLRLMQGTAINTTLIDEPSSTNNSTGTCAPEMYQTTRGSPWHFLMMARIGVDADFRSIEGILTKHEAELPYGLNPGASCAG